MGKEEDQSPFKASFETGPIIKGVLFGFTFGVFVTTLFSLDEGESLGRIKPTKKELPWANTEVIWQAPETKIKK